MTPFTLMSPTFTSGLTVHSDFPMIHAKVQLLLQQLHIALAQRPRFLQAVRPLIFASFFRRFIAELIGIILFPPCPTYIISTMPNNRFLGTLYFPSILSLSDVHYRYPRYL